MKLSKTAPALLAAALLSLSSMAGCGASKSLLSGDAAQILSEVVAKVETILKDSGGALPPSITDPVPEEKSKGILGISTEDYREIVESASSSTAAINTSAHEITVVKCKAGQAEKALGLMRSGYDSQKWVCVAPEKCILMSSGDYIMLVASKETVCGAAVEAFNALSGGSGEADAFFTRQ